MYNPKGGDKPAYDPQYPKPPVEEPPKENPPDEYPTDKQPPGNGKTCDPPTGDCTCPEWPIEDCPAENVPFRRLLQKFEDILEELSEKPDDATKKFAEDLKDADKEYTGVTALVNKYKEFYDKLPCKMAEVANWQREIANWTANKPPQAEKDAIKNSRQTDYEDKERKICCDWIQCRDYYLTMLDCLEQSKKKEEEAKENYDAIKNLEKTLGERFDELKALFQKADGFNKEERYRAVYAVSLEFEDVLAELSLIRDWVYARNECGIDTGDEGGYGTGDPREAWPPEKFKAALVRHLRLLLLARYQRFRWHHDFLTRVSDNQKKKEACEKFRKERRDKFIQESEDVEAPDGGGGGYGEQPTPEPEYPSGPKPPEYPPPPPPQPEYPGGQKPEYPTKPPPPPPPPEYPTGQKPEYPPPTQQYGTQQQPEYPETPPPAPQSRGRQKS